MRAFSGNGQQAIPRADPRRTLEPAAVHGGCRLQMLDRALTEASSPATADSVATSPRFRRDRCDGR
jgi:hypothetical protein